MITATTTIDGRSQIQVHTTEQQGVHSARSSLTVTYPSTNQGRRCLTSVNVPLLYSHGHHRKPNQQTPHSNMTTCIVSNGSTNISHNGAVAHGNVKGRRLSKERNAVAMTSKSSLIYLVIRRWSRVWPQNSNTVVNFLCLHCKSFSKMCKYTKALSILYIGGKFVQNVGSWNRKRTIADGNYSLLDEQSEHWWKKNVWASTERNASDTMKRSK